MRKIVTGIDEAGRSCALHEETMAFAPAPHATLTGFSSARVFATTESPPPIRPAGHAARFSVDVDPGLLRWTVFEFPPGFSTPVHHTDSLDFDMVLQGSIDLVLDDGPHLLEAGDCAVITGVDHGWQVGPDGCVMSVTIVGTPPRA